jgi:glyoxylase-like metal-dependent hydrolase (beta-lactamase superfamily II)
MINDRWGPDFGRAATLAARTERSRPAAGDAREQMADEIQFDRSFDAVAGAVDRVAPRVRRVLAPNPGPFTFKGTCSYIVGEGEVAIVDPGPDDARHVAALLDALEGERVTHILLTHRHSDHVGALPALQARTGVAASGGVPIRTAPRPPIELPPTLDAGADPQFRPDHVLGDGERIVVGDVTLTAVTTPGHAADHLAFALHGSPILLSGDHVMGWSTSVVAPPDGSMGDYMASLYKLKARPETLYFPGHGGPVRDAHAYLERLIEHRAAREAAILRGLERGSQDIPSLVRGIYLGLDPRLHGAAGLSVFAHLEDLLERGIVVTDGPASLTGHYRLRA